MRVAINMEQLLYQSPGGIGRYSSRLMTLLPRLYSEDDYVAFCARHSHGDIAAAWERFGLTAQPLPCSLPLPRPLLYDAWHLLGMPRLSQANRRLRDLDVIHAPSVAVPPKGGTRLIVTLHDAAPLLHPETYPRHGRWFHAQGIRAAAKRADLIITASAAAADELTSHSAISADRIRVVPHGVDPMEVTPEAQRAMRQRFGIGEGPYVLWVGSLEPRKNVKTLVAAMAILTRRRPDPPTLVLAGYRGWLADDALQPGHRRELGDRLKLIGEVSEADIQALYAGAAVFALPSVHEGFGLPLLEAMAQRTPVVCSDIPALREVSGGAARLVPPTDAEAWADAIDALLTDAAAVARQVEAGAARAASFTWEKTARATHDVYTEVA
jgi:glycosyltransferase involved in cell wall biosynthesis